MQQGWIGIIIALSFAASAQEAKKSDTRLVRETEALSPEAEREKLRVPEGFSVQLFAAEPQINKPTNIAFDSRGRLWVSSTVEYPYAAARDRWADAEGSRVKDSRDAIKVLEDTDGDGHADKVTDFADGLNIPTGMLPWTQPGDEAGCIAWSIPNIWYFGDRDGDGRCDSRRVLFGPLGFEKDTHGMCSSFRMGSDGWVYATHGFNNTSQIRVRPENLKNGAQLGDPGTALDLHSGSVFRFRPDGSQVEIWSWGQVNPFGLAWDRRGYLYSADCHSAPIYQLLRGAHYPSFGKPHDGLGFAPGMCEHTHGSTGICGIAIRDDRRWGPDWDERIFIGNVVTSRVNADRLDWRGATPVAVEQPDFVVSDDPWFRPVDLRFGPDGALYVADFYNRIIGHYEVPLAHPGRDRERGRIWRIVKDGPVGPEQAPSHAAVTPDTAVEMLATLDPHDRRAAADLLQAQPQAEALSALAVALQQASAEDTHLRHALKLAIREHLRLPGAFEKLSDLPGASDVDFSAVALAVPSPAAAAYLIGHWEKRPATDEAWKLSALGHVGRHGDGDQTKLAIALAKEEADAAMQTVRLAALHAGRLEREGAVLTPDLSAWALHLAHGFLAEKRPETIPDWVAAPHADFPKSESPWGLQTRRCADGKEIEVLSSLRQGENQAEQRAGVVKSRAFAAPGTLSLWLCGHRGPPKTAAHDRNLIRVVRADTGAVLASAFPPRNDVAQRVTLDLSKAAGAEVRLEIVDGDTGGAYAWLGVGRIEPPVVAVERFAPSDRRDASLGVLAQILRHTAPVDLREKLAAFLPPAPKAPATTAVSPEQRAEADRLITTRVGQFKAGKADAAKGRAIFTTHCAVCHQIGGEGGLIGPQLDGIGKRGVDRLCEDILDPNRNVDAHFHLHLVTLKDGSTTGGFARSETAQVIRLIDPAGREYPVKKSDIAQSQVSPISLMPPTFGALLDEAAFRDLIGWLLERE